MAQIKFNQPIIKMLMLITCCIFSFSFSTNFGLDSYEIYLNSKLILKQTVNQPLDLRVLQLDKAKESDELRIIYTHCTTKGAGTDRSIILKNENGNIVKKWVFENTSGSDLDMAIPVKELLELQKANVQHELTIHYTSGELPKGEMLSLVKFKG